MRIGVYGNGYDLFYGTVHQLPGGARKSQKLQSSVQELNPLPLE
jgi:hypothetical protein